MLYLWSARFINFLKKRLLKDRMIYIFLDEIQNVNEFPKVVVILYIKDNVGIYVTGSKDISMSTLL